MSLFPRLSERGRLVWLIVAAITGTFAIGVALWRGDRAVAGLIAFALALLVGIWAWARTGDDGEDHRT